MHESYGRDLDLNLLRVFAVVAEAGSVTEAARRLGMPLRTLVHKLKVLGIKRLGYAPGDEPHS